MDVVGLSDGDRSYVLDKTRAAIAKLGQTNYGELAGFMKDSMDSRYCIYAYMYWCNIPGFPIGLHLRLTRISFVHPMMCAK